MNETSHDYMRQVILERLTELENEDALGAAGKATVTLDQQAVGRLSRVDALQNQAMAKATETRRATQRRRLQAALHRLSNGEYGFCEDCGETIAPGRLQLDPAALKCVDCATG